MFGKIVVDDKTVHAVVTEVLADSAARIWSEELQGSSIRGGSSNNDGVLEGVTFSEESHDV